MKVVLTTLTCPGVIADRAPIRIGFGDRETDTYWEGQIDQGVLFDRIKDLLTEEKGR